MKRSTKIWLWTAIILILIAIFISIEKNNPHSAKGGKIQIGVVLPLTGKYASISEDAQNGLLLAQETYSEKINLAIEDSAGESQKSISAITNLIHNKKSDIILAGPGSTANIAMAQVANTSEIPLMAITSTPELMAKDDFVFTLLPSITGEAKKMADVQYAKGARTASVIYDSTSDTLTTASKLFSERFTAQGGQVLLSEGHVAEVDYKTLATKAIFKKPDVIYMLSLDKITAPLLKNLRDLGYKGPVAGFSATENDEFLRNSKTTNEGFTITAIPFSCDSNINTKDYCSRYRAKFNREPAFYGAYMYDTARLIAAAYDTCPNRKFKPCLLSYPKLSDTLTDSFQFDEFGDLPDDLPIKIKRVENGKFVEVK